MILEFIYVNKHTHTQIKLQGKLRKQVKYHQIKYILNYQKHIHKHYAFSTE